MGMRFSFPQALCRHATLLMLATTVFTAPLSAIAQDSTSTRLGNRGIYSVSSDRFGGGHHGNETDMLGAAVDFVARNHSGSFLRLGVDQRICAMQRRLGENPLRSKVLFVAKEMSVHVDATPQHIADLIVSPAYCQELYAFVIRPVLKQAPVHSIPFFVDQDGIPVSRNNRVFDLCIRGQAVFLPLIRMNPDRIQLDHRGKVMVGASCQKYSLHDSRWRHPDYPELEYFTFTLKPQVLLSVPAPYVITQKTDDR